MIKYNIKYINSLESKSDIFKDNKNKIGIYRWINRVTKESYIGSSVNITRRLRKYFCKGYLNDRLSIYNSNIYRALLNYNYSNFSLEILEYCDKESLIKREQYYIDNFKPEYNICKTAGSMLGFKHSKETLLKFKNRDSSNSCKIIIINLKNNKVNEYNSIRGAAKSLGTSHTTLLRYMKGGKIFEGIYSFILKK